MKSSLQNCTVSLMTKISVMKLGKRNEQKAALMLPWAVFDGAKILMELVGLYIQSNLDNILPKTNFRLYRDDGLIHLKNLND